MTLKEIIKIVGVGFSSNQSYKKAQEYKLAGFQGNALIIPIYGTQLGREQSSRIRTVFMRVYRSTVVLLRYSGVWEARGGDGHIKCCRLCDFSRPDPRQLPTVPSPSWGSTKATEKVGFIMHGSPGWNMTPKM